MHGKIKMNNESEWELVLSSSKTTHLNDALQWRRKWSVNTYLNFFQKAII